MTRINGLLSRRSAAGWRTPAWPNRYRSTPIRQSAGVRRKDGSSGPPGGPECYNIGVFSLRGNLHGLADDLLSDRTKIAGMAQHGWLPSDPVGDDTGPEELAAARESRAVHWPVTSSTRGLVGNYDRLQLMVSNRPVDRGDELWFYYTGMKRRGGAARPLYGRKPQVP